MEAGVGGLRVIYSQHYQFSIQFLLDTRATRYGFIDASTVTHRFVSELEIYYQCLCSSHTWDSIRPSLESHGWMKKHRVLLDTFKDKILFLCTRVWQISKIYFDTPSPCKNYTSTRCCTCGIAGSADKNCRSPSSKDPRHRRVRTILDLSLKRIVSLVRKRGKRRGTPRLLLGTRLLLEDLSRNRIPSIYSRSTRPHFIIWPESKMLYHSH